MDFCSNKYCPKKEDCGRTRKEYFGAMLEVLKRFNPDVDKCFIRRRSGKC
jgi:hypothetical protein